MKLLRRSAHPARSGSVTAVVACIVLLLGGLVFAGLATVMTTTTTMTLVFISLVVVYFVGVIFVFMLAEMIFNTALYAYASEGSIAPGYDQELFEGALRTK